MQHTLVAVFDNRNDARNAMNELLSSGYANAHVHLSNADPTGQTDSISGEAGPDDRTGSGSGIAASIRHFFLDLFGSDHSEHATRYEGMVTRGHHVLTLSADSLAEIERAADIVERYGPTDIDEHLGEPTGSEAGAEASAAASAEASADDSGIEAPQVRPRPVSGTRPTLDNPGDGHLFQQRSLNQTGPGGTTWQEPLPSSGLGATGSTELHRSTLRDRASFDDPLEYMPPPASQPGYQGASMQSDTGSPMQSDPGSAMQGGAGSRDDQLRSDSQQRAGTQNWSGAPAPGTPGSMPAQTGIHAMDDEEALRAQYEREFASTGMSYDAFSPAYRFGSDMARSNRYSSGDFGTFEPDLRAQWEASNRDEASTWDRIKAAVRRGWESLSGDADDDYYRAHYEANFAGTGTRYDKVRDAYVYGSEMRHMDAYRDQPWDNIESSLRTGWDSRIGDTNDGTSTWERVKAAVRHGWENLRDDDDDAYFRDHWQAVYGRSGGSFDDARDAYAYGTQMAHDGRFSTRRWEEAEPALRQGWESMHSGAGQDWAAMRAAVRAGWERAAR